MGCQSIRVLTAVAMLLMLLGARLGFSQISGHAYRADTGKPLTGVVVVLASPALGATRVRLTQTRTNVEGSYKFVGLSPGNYTVSGYRKGFAFSFYGMSRSGGTFTALTIGSGQKLADINLKLHPVPNVTQMDDGALTAAYSKERPDLQFALGRFSPDGKLLAFTVGDPAPSQVWLYNLTTKRLTPITPKPSPTDGLVVHNVAWSGDELYAETNLFGHTSFFAATGTEANKINVKEMSQLPTQAAAAFHRRWPFFTKRVRNKRFIVWADWPCHGCSFNLKVTPADPRSIYQLLIEPRRVINVGSPPDPRGTYRIASGGWELTSFVFKRHNSLVLYPTSRYYFDGVVVIFDLNTRRSQKTYLPVIPERLLGAMPEPNGFLVAYTTYGSCNLTGPNPLSRWRLHSHYPTNVCFAEVPFKAGR